MLAVPLPISIQHEYSYSKWDQIHEPHNVVENILRDDETVYKALTPDLDLTLDKGDLCYISEVLIWPGDGGPSQVQVLVSNNTESWSLVKEFACAREGCSKLVVPSEIHAKHLRIKCVSNSRGGQIVSVRHVIVKGLNKSKEA